LELPFRITGKPATWELTSLLSLVGRSERCQFVVNDNNVSQYHACLVRTPLGVWVIDLASRDGVYVNDVRIRWAWLAEGDQVRLSQFPMVVRYETLPEGISREDVPLSAGAMPVTRPNTSIQIAANSFDTHRSALSLPTDGGATNLVRQTSYSQLPERPSSPNLDGQEWEPMFPAGPDPTGIWQQQVQMMKGFHNDMQMMFQMFVAMHREHLGSVRNELNRVQELTRELDRLNAKLDRISESPASKATADSGASDVKSADSKLRPEVKIRAEGQSEKPTDRTKSGRVRGQTGAIRSPVPVAKGPESNRPATSPTTTTADTYADLARRIAEIQRERQGYWKTILKVVNR
jgi:hypothetical protein